MRSAESKAVVQERHRTAKPTRVLTGKKRCWQIMAKFCGYWMAISGYCVDEGNAWVSAASRIEKARTRQGGIP